MSVIVGATSPPEAGRVFVRSDDDTISIAMKDIARYQLIDSSVWRVTAFSALAVIGPIVMGTGCAASSDKRSVLREIAPMLQRQAEAWNAGDLEAFMDPYWHSDELTFSAGGSVTRGWEPTLANYRRRYPTREKMGTLTFSDLEITALGRNAALVLGRWHLERDDPVGGAFSLVLRRMADMPGAASRWVIIHDHTSRDAP